MSKGDAFDFAAKILQTGEGTDREKFLARAVVRRTNEVTELKEMRIARIEDMCDPDGEPCYADICWRPHLSVFQPVFIFVGDVLAI